MSATRPKCTKIGDFLECEWNLPNIYMALHTCLKRLVVINNTSVSSLGSITYNKCLQTDLDRVNTMYADGHVIVLFARK